MTAIYLIRHGQTEFNRKGKLPGWLPGIPLNPTGREQVARLAESFRSIRLQAIYSSPLDRARQTAAALAEAQRLPVQLREGLADVRPGSWEGLSLRALRRRKLWATFQLAPSLARFPQGESFLEAQARVVDTLEKLRLAHRGPIACVSHGDPIRLAVAHYLGLPLDLFHRLAIDTASVSLIEVVPRSARLLQLNAAQPTGPATAG
jgi:probable phosphoglycerate mutase